jgi:hypothetical protein
MRIRVLLCVCLCLFTMRCATYYHIFSTEKSTYFTEKEQALLEKTTHSIDFDYGYDQVMDLDYVFPVTQGFTTYKDGDRELSRVLDGVDAKDVVAFYEKMYRLKKETEMRMEKYREDGNWRNYTYIDRYIRPPMEHYTGVLERQAVRRDRVFSGEVEKRKKAIDQNVRFEKKKNDFEALWKNDYNS